MSALSADFTRQSSDTWSSARQVAGLPLARNLARRFPAQEIRAYADPWVGYRLLDPAGKFHMGTPMSTTLEDKQSS
jgi:hypothetical protein